VTEPKTAADDLCEVVFSMDDVDLNALMDDDVSEFIEHKQALGEMTRRYRQNQHALGRCEGDDE